MSEAADESGRSGAERCSICKGTEDEHGEAKGIRHAFAREGEPLETPEQRARRTAPKAAPQVNRVLTMGGNSQEVSRLVEVLIAHNLITQEDALYIAGYKPDFPRPSTFQDPARAFYVESPGNGV